MAHRLALSFLLLGTLILAAGAQNSILDSVGALPICAQACITSAFSTCKDCKLGDFSCSCRCSTFRPFSEACFKSSCNASHIKQGLDTIAFTCSQYTSSSTGSSPSSSITTPARPVQPITTSGQVFTPTGTVFSTTGGRSNPSQSKALPDPAWPSSIIGPACVPIRDATNISYPLKNDWTNGIIWVDGTWRNASCVSNSTNSPGGYEQASTSDASTTWMSALSLGVVGIAVFTLL